VFSATPEEHEAHLRQCFQNLHDVGHKINLKMTVLARAEVNFCGYLISDDVICPPPEKLEQSKTTQNRPLSKASNLFWVQ